MAKAPPKLADRADAPCCTPSVKVSPRATKPYARLFKALGDETRLEMLGLIAASGMAELCACDIEGHFALSQPTISHHLKILRDAGLVTGERRGTWVYYSLDKDTLRLLSEFKALLGG
jgi:ArsR family transcriptional regulator